MISNAIPFGWVVRFEYCIHFLSVAVPWQVFLDVQLSVVSSSVPSSPGLHRLVPSVQEPTCGDIQKCDPTPVNEADGGSY